MDDKVWFIVIGAIFIVIGIIFIRLGIIIWIRLRIDLIMRCHMDKVKEENKIDFCRLVGIGLLIIGAGMMFSGIWIMITGELLSFIPMACGIVLGTVMIFASVIRYNKQ